MSSDWIALANFLLHHQQMTDPIANLKPLTTLDKFSQIEHKLRLLKFNDAVRGEYEAAMDSLYRWWWECLRESEDYAAALKGQLGEPYASVASDFGELGDVFGVWWVDTGRFLFSTAVYQAQVSEIIAADAQIDGDRMAVWWDGARPNSYLRIPLTLDRRDIMREVGELVDQALAKRHAEIEAAAKPKRQLYPDQRIRRSSIKIMLELWRARKATEEEWWQTGERLGHWPQFTCEPSDDEAAIKHKRRIMTLTLQRFHKTAAKLIEFAAKGDFPRVK